MSSSPEKANQNKPENLWLNLGCNIVAPALILSKLSGDEYLGTKLALIVALAFPLGYGLKDFVERNKINVFSILGLVSTLATGAISLAELDPQYIAIKEAAIPAIFFLLVLISTWTPYPLVEKFIFNDAIFNLEKLNNMIEEKQAESELQHALKKASYMVAASFALSSVLNYILASMIVVSDPGSVAYNEELGKLTALSYPVIALPSMSVMLIGLWGLIKQIQKISGEDIEVFLRMNPNENTE